MCILRVCCCLLRVSDVRVFLLGIERGGVSERGRALSHRPPGACEPTWFVT